MKQFETKGRCPYCKQITFIAEWENEPECVNCGKSIREKDLINPIVVEVEQDEVMSPTDK